MRDCHERKVGEFDRQYADLERERKQLDRDIDGFLNRLLAADDPILIKTYENKIKELESKRQLMSAATEQRCGIDISFDGALGTVLDFIKSPLSMWENGDLDDKRLVLKLVFAKQLPFDKETGFGTALTSLPFKVFQEISAGKVEMVEGAGFEPT